MSEEKTLMDFVRQANPVITEVEMSEVVALLDYGYQVPDVRESAEYASGTIDGVVNIPRGIYTSLKLTDVRLNILPPN